MIMLAGRRSVSTPWHDKCISMTCHHHHLAASPLRQHALAPCHRTLSLGTDSHKESWPSALGKGWVGKPEEEA